MPGWFWLVLAAAILHAAWNYSARRINGNFAAVWVGLCLSSLLGLPAILFFPGFSLKPAFSYLAVTGPLNALYFFVLAKAYEAGEMTEVYPIARGAAVLGGVISGHWIFREALPPAAGACVFAILLGILLVGFRPISRREEFSVFFFSLTLGILVATSAVIDKMAMRVVSPFAYIVALWAIAAVLLAPYVWFRRKEECLKALKRGKADGFLVGGGSMAAYFLILTAFKSGPLSLISAARESSILFGAILGVWKLKEKLTPRRAWGIAAIVCGLVALRLSYESY